MVCESYLHVENATTKLTLNACVGGGNKVSMSLGLNCRFHSCEYILVHVVEIPFSFLQPITSFGNELLPQIHGGH